MSEDRPMWIMRIVGDCLSCGGLGTYGNVSVRKDHVLRFCRACSKEFWIPLPPVRKKVLYLDQFFFSHAFRGGDARFRDAAERVRRAAHLQLIVAPYSSVHEDETHLWRGFKELKSEELMDFIKAAARGATFERDYAVELTQTLKAFSGYMAGNASEYQLDRKEAIEGQLDEWDDYLFIDVGGYRRDIELNRRLKDEAVNNLVDVFDAWQRSTATFDQHVDLEYRDAGRIYFGYFFKKGARMAQGDWYAALDSPIRVRVIEQMLEHLPDDMPPNAKLETCAKFFNSEHFRQIPFEWLSARMFATLKAMVRRGAYANRKEAKKRLSGVMSDITHISRYAPYCDAFVMDAPMADLVRQPTVALEKRYGVRVFSLSNWDEFLAWLAALEADMSNDHRAGVAAAYPGAP